MDGADHHRCGKGHQSVPARAAPSPACRQRRRGVRRDSGRPRTNSRAENTASDAVPYERRTDRRQRRKMTLDIRCDDGRPAKPRSGVTVIRTSSPTTRTPGGRPFRRATLGVTGQGVVVDLRNVLGAGVGLGAETGGVGEQALGARRQIQRLEIDQPAGGVAGAGRGLGQHLGTARPGASISMLRKVGALPTDTPPVPSACPG